MNSGRCCDFHPHCFRREFVVLFLLAVRCWFVFICWSSCWDQKTFEVLRLPRWQSIGLIGESWDFFSTCWNQEAKKQRWIEEAMIEMDSDVTRAPKNITKYWNTNWNRESFLSNSPYKIWRAFVSFPKRKNVFFSPFWVFVRCSCLLCWWPPLACSCLEKTSVIVQDAPR